MGATPRETRREKRLRSIKDAAMQLVVEDGIDGFSVHKLADRVDLTAGALYRYFESRDEMLISVQAEVLAVFDRYLALVLGDYAEEPVLTQITVACRAYVALADLQPERFRLNAQFIAAPQPVFDAEKVEPTAQVTISMLGRLALRLQRAQDEGLFREGNSARRAVLAWSSVHALVQHRKLERLSPDSFNPAALLDELLVTLLVGWGASLKAAQLAANVDVPMDTLCAAMAVAEQTEVD